MELNRQAIELIDHRANHIQLRVIPSVRQKARQVIHERKNGSAVPEHLEALIGAMATAVALQEREHELVFDPLRISDLMDEMLDHPEQMFAYLKRYDIEIETDSGQSFQL